MSEKTSRAKRTTSGVLSAVAFLGLGCVAPWTFAADKVWVTDLADWNTPGAWNPPPVPVAGDNNYIGNNLTANITADVPQTQEVYVGGVSDNGQNIAGPGTLNQTGGTLTLRGGNAWFVVGQRGGTTGTYNLSGGTVDLNNDDFTVGQDGTGFFNMSGNAVALFPSVQMGRWNTGNGTGVQGGTSSITATGEFVVGRQGTATYTLNSGSLTVQGDMQVGRGDGADPNRPSTGVFTQNGGTVTVGTGFNAGGWLYVGGHDSGTGTGTYNFHHGTINTATRLQIAQGGGSTGTFNQDGADTLITAPTVEVGQGGIGTYNMSSGVLNSFGDAGVISGAWAGGDGRLNVSGNAVINANFLRVARGDVGNNIVNKGLVTQSGGTINISDTVSIGLGNPGDVAVYTMTGGLLKLGTGGLRIADDGSTGTFNLQGGTINAQGHGITHGNGTAAFVVTGGRIQGASNVDFALSMTGGTLAPAGTKTTVNGAFTLGTPATLEVALNGNTPVTQYDQMAATGAVSLLGNLSVIPGFTPNVGDQFEIIDNQGASPILGQFANAPGGVFAVGAMQFSVNYQGGDGNDVVLTLTQVPEPSILCLSGLAFAGLMSLRPSRRVNPNA